MSAATSPPLTPHRGVSLAGRIILLNILAMALMLAGLFYLGRYADRLILAETRSLTNQATMLAHVLGTKAPLEEQLADDVLAGLDKETDSEVKVFDAAGKLLSVAGELQLDSNAAADTAEAQDVASWLASFIPVRFALEGFPLTSDLGESLGQEARLALEGNARSSLWRLPNEMLVITVAVPVPASAGVGGVVMLSRSSAEVASAVRDLRVEMLQSFLLVLAVIALLSLYLARNIGVPLTRLARAATQARTITAGKPAIPDYGWREDEIGDLSRAIGNMTDTLWERLNAIEHFAADVAHEIKNPLSSLRSALETLGKVSDPEARARLLAVMNDDVTRLDRLITDISQASRLEAELSRTEAEPTNLVELLSGLITTRQQVLINHQRIELKPEQVRVVVSGVPGRLVQVFENLMGNALSFSPAEGRVVVRVGISGEIAEVSVEDDGPGIPDGKLETIFERFYSERPEQEQFGQHSGLGLSICRQIVNGHGGRIFAQNRRGEDGRILGARFTVQLPLAKQA